MKPITVTTMTAENDTAALKAQRKLGRGSRRSVLSGPPPAAAGLAPGSIDVEQDLPPLPDAHTTMTAALARPSGLAALDPLARRRPAVAELGGHVPDGILSDYVISAFDATEQVTPRGCITPVARLLWCTGQHVRRDVYQTYLNSHPELAQSIAEKKGDFEANVPNDEIKSAGPDATEDGLDASGDKPDVPPSDAPESEMEEVASSAPDGGPVTPVAS